MTNDEKIFTCKLQVSLCETRNDFVLAWIYIVAPTTVYPYKSIPLISCTSQIHEAFLTHFLAINSITY